MLFRHTAIYLIAHGVPSLIGFAIYTLYTHFLSPAEYGIYTIGVNVMGILVAFLFAWIRLSVVRLQAENETTDIRLTALVAYGISLAILPLILVGLVGVFGLPFERVAVAIFVAGALGLFELNQEILRSRLMSVHFTLSAIIRSVFTFIAALFVVSYSGGGLGAMMALGVSYIIASLIFIPWTWKKPVLPFDHETFLQLIRFGMPIVVSGLIYSLHNAADRLTIIFLLGDEAAGFYGAAFDLTRQIILLPAISAISAILPLAIRIFTTGNKTEIKAYLKKSGELFLAIIIPTAVGFIMVSDKLAGVIMGPDFRAQGIILMPILTIAIFFGTFSHHFIHMSFILSKKFFLATVYHAILLILGVAAMIPLVHFYGLLGAAYGTVAIEGLGVILALGLTRFAVPLTFSARALINIFLATTFMVIICMLTKMMFEKSDVLILLMAMVSSGIISYSLGCIFFNICETREFCKKFLEKISRKPTPL